MGKYFLYDCKRCGMCCRRVDLVPGMELYNRGDGVCKHLQDDNLCAIYEKRPDLCNGQYVYKTYYSDMTVTEYHKMIARYCEKIRSNDIEGLYKNQSCD